MTILQSPAALAPWKRNIRLITVIRLIFSLIFAAPVISLYWQRHGLSLFDIFLLQAIFSFSVVLFEISTGYLGDRLGRKKTIFLAALINIGGWILYASARFFAAFALPRSRWDCRWPFSPAPIPRSSMKA